jgi:hypothetical protein
MLEELSGVTELFGGQVDLRTKPDVEHDLIGDNFANVKTGFALTSAGMSFKMGNLIRSGRNGIVRGASDRAADEAPFITHIRDHHGSGREAVFA